MDHRDLTFLADVLIETGERLTNRATVLRATRGEGHHVLDLLRECVALCSNGQLDVQEFIYKHMSSDRKSG